MAIYMEKEKKNEIIRITKILRKVLKLSTPISEEELVGAIKIMGGKIEEVEDFDSLYEGSIKKDEKGFTIKISKNLGERRKLFTIAHEIGHLFLHMRYLIDEDVWEKQNDKVYTRFGNTEQEIEANEFAANLLMPEDEFMESVYANASSKMIDIERLADEYNVSVPTAITRGRILEVIL